MSVETHETGAVAPRFARRPGMPDAPASMYRVTLTLARCPEHPDGSAGRGYEILAPLRPGGHLDAELWREARDRCRVRRFWVGERDRHGRLVHRAGGEGGATWLIDYEDWTNEDDETGYRLGTHAFVEGEYVSIRDADDETYHTFRVAHVSRLEAGGRP